MKKSRPGSYKGNGFWFIVPALVILGGFGLAVTAANLWYSFLDWSALSAPKFVFLKNYRRFFSDPIALTSLLNTFKYAFLYVVPTVVFSLAVALTLNRQSKAMYFFRTLFYIPVVTSYVIVIVVWQWFFDFDIGLFNQILAVFGIAKQPWLLSKDMSMPSLVLLSIWKNSGYSILIFLAGLQTVDKSLYEAAKIDGCGSRALFFNITLPQLRSTTVLTVVMVTTWSFQMFVQPYLLTQGGPDYSTSTIYFYLYQQAFTSYNVGYGSAIAVVGVVLFLVVIGIEKRLLGEGRQE